MELDKIKKVFVEERDTSAPLGLPEFNKLKIETVNNGVGNYIVISTKRWAIDADNIEEFCLELRIMLDGLVQ